MLEHAIRLNLVQRGFKETLLVQVFLILFGEGAELLSLLVEELEISSTFVGNVPVTGLLDFVLVPLNFSIPVILLVFLIIFIIECEIRLLGSVLAF